MTSRERYLKTLKFQPVDRVPLTEWPIREATLNAWHSQGMPSGSNSYTICDLDPYLYRVPIGFSHCPPFEETTLEVTDRHRIWIDAEGATRIDAKDIATPGFATRKWLKFPIS